MRLLALTPDGPGGQGGIARYGADCLAAIAGMPEIDRVTVLPRRNQGGDVAPGVEVRRSVGGRAGFMAAAAMLGMGADAILCAHLNLLPAAVAARALGRRAPIQLLLYGVEAWTPRMARLIGSVDQVVAISAVTAGRFAAWSGRSADRVALLAPAVDETRFTPGPADSGLARRLGIDGGPVVLGLGRLSELERYKGFDEMIGIMPTLLRRHPGLVYVVAGEGGDRPRLEALAAERGVGGRVVFSGFVDEADKVGLYRLADAFVLAGRGEGFGIALIEAMACGVPAVGSRLDGSREAVADGRLGEMADPGDPADLAAAVDRALARGRGRPEGVERFFLGPFRARARALCRDLLLTA